MTLPAWVTETTRPPNRHGRMVGLRYDHIFRCAYLRRAFQTLMVDKLPSKFCTNCGHQLQGDNEFCPKCGTSIGAKPAAQTSTQPTPRSGKGWGVGKWVLVAVIVFIILIVPVFPRDTIVYVNGTTQTVTNQIQYSTSFQVYTTTTASQISVYTGTYQYFSNYYYNYYYNYWGGSYCYWYGGTIVCNYSYWPWYAPSYGTTANVSPADKVVSITRVQQPSGLETLTLTHYNGHSTIVRNVYSDNLSQSGTSTVQTNAVVTNTITNTVTTPVTLTVPCSQCIPEHVTEYVSILQMLLGY